MSNQNWTKTSRTSPGQPRTPGFSGSGLNERIDQINGTKPAVYPSEGGIEMTDVVKPPPHECSGTDYSGPSD